MPFIVIYEVYRKEGMSHEEFVEYWMNTHAPIAAKLPNVRTYTNFPVTSATDVTDPPDGVSILTFDSQEDFEAMLASPDMEVSGEDAARFTSRFGVLTAERHDIV
jgi:uncharacterized protein (TIGR02118 family)